MEAEIADELFVSKGLMIKERNYLEVYTYDKWSDKTIPVFVNGEAFRPTELNMTSGRTQVCRLPAVNVFPQLLCLSWSCDSLFAYGSMSSSHFQRLRLRSGAVLAFRSGPDPDDESLWYWYRRYHCSAHHHRTDPRLCRWVG